MCTVINDNAYFLSWMIVVCCGQVFKYYQTVFKYQHQYMGITRMHGSAIRSVRSHSCSIWNMANLTPL